MADTHKFVDAIGVGLGQQVVRRDVGYTDAAWSLGQPPTPVGIERLPVKF